MKYFLLPIILFSAFLAKAQNAEVYPVFPECKSVNYNSLQNCFKNTLVDFVVDHFEVPSSVITNNYTGEIAIVFEVTKEGAFKLMYVNAAYDELKADARGRE